MNIRSSKILVSLFFLLFVLNGCAEQLGKAKTKQKKVFKHDTPLIKEDVKKLGQIELEKSAKMGPTPVEGDVQKLQKRKQISSVKEKNYLLIPDDYMMLKQQVTLKVPASILSGKGLCFVPLSTSTPLISIMSVPYPLILAPILFKNRHKSETSGSLAALLIFVSPLANDAAIIIFSVPVTDFLSKVILAPFNLCDCAVM